MRRRRPEHRLALLIAKHGGENRMFPRRPFEHVIEEYLGGSLCDQRQLGREGSPNGSRVIGIGGAKDLPRHGSYEVPTGRRTDQWAITLSAKEGEPLR